MRAGAAGLRASGSRCDLRRRAALPPCRPRSVGRGGSAPSAPRSTRDVGQRPPQICESDRHAKRGDRPRAPGGASAPSRARPALAGSPHTEDQDCSWPINRDRPQLDVRVFAPEMLVRPRVPRVQGMTEGKPSCPITRSYRTCLTPDTRGAFGVTKRRPALPCRREPRRPASASSSTLTPALIQRTLAWLSTSSFGECPATRPTQSGHDIICDNRRRSRAAAHRAGGPAYPAPLGRIVSALVLRFFCARSLKASMSRRLPNATA